MLTVDQYEYIRIAYRIYGKTIRKIARETGHSRNTVKKVLNNEHIEYSPQARFCKNKGETKGIKDFINVLLLHKEYNDQNIRNAVKKAIEVNVSDSNAVLQILTNSLEKPTKSFVPLTNWEIVPTPDISVYNEIGGDV